MKLIIFIFCVVAPNTSFAAWTDTKEYTDKILSIYNEPTSSTTAKLIMYAFFYLDEMFKLEEGIEEGNKECKEFLVLLDAEGGPKHINNIPWGKFIEELKWTGADVSEFENVINKTKQSWADLKKALAELPTKAD